MQTRAYYENQISKNIHSLDYESLKKFYLLTISFKDIFTKTEEKTLANNQSTGFCGCWTDDRSADEIIKDIESSRTGFGDREIEL